MLTGLIAPEAGRILLDGRDVTRWPFHRRARAGLNYLPQEPSVFRKLSVLQNLWVVLEAHGVPRSERLGRALELLERLGIAHLAAQRADALSAGERRRVEIARALAASPRFLLLDEPFTGIDPRSIEELHQILQRLRDEGLGIVITDHNVRDTLAITDVVYLIYEGRVVWAGRPDEMAESPVARRFYLGERFRL